jgi:hypothetical protein
MKNLIAISFLILLASCASVQSVWEGGKEVVTGTVDAVVQGTSTVVSAVAEDVVDTAAFVADTTAGVVKSGAEFADEQTDALQDEEESPKE